jgi:hypothetical protein
MRNRYAFHQINQPAYLTFVTSLAINSAVGPPRPLGHCSDMSVQRGRPEVCSGALDRCD